MIALGLLEGDRAAGLYAAPQRVVLFLTAISSMFGAALYPRLSALHAEGREGFERVMSLGFRTMILIGVPIGVGGALVAPALIGAIYAPEYQAGATVFRWLVPSVIPIFANVPFGYALLAAGRQRTYFRASLAGAVTNVVATLVLIPRLHLLGPVVATLITESLVLGVLIVKSREVGRVTAGREIASVGISAAAMTLALITLRPESLAAQVLLGAFVYGATLVVSGGLDRSDLALLRALVRSARSA